MKVRFIKNSCLILSLLQLLVVFSSCSNDDDDNIIGYLSERSYSITDNKDNNFKISDYPGVNRFIFPSFSGNFTVILECEKFKDKVYEAEEWDIQTIETVSCTRACDITNAQFLKEQGISAITKTSNTSWTIHLLPFSGTEPKVFHLTGTMRFKGQNKRNWYSTWYRYPEGSPVDQLYSGKLSLEDCLFKLQYGDIVFD
ncbi:MAG: hypothetical protein NC201_07725 [Prevotella sp.]|nr:hypothetical protein [Bacteroides sp.]MCM1367117.1 hypothetical protein [Prevotella sp.]MCM1437352.1 hypothetical protein [Prevotella sp.]